MGKWNLVEFKKLCSATDKNQAYILARSLAFKYRAARDYHKYNILDRLAKIKNEGSAFLLTSEFFQCELEIGFEADALVSALNSMWDIIAQLLNECFGNPKLPVKSVCFDNIVKKCSLSTDIKDAVGKMLCDKYYKEIRSYCNVSKHHYAIEGDIKVDFGKNIKRVSYQAKQFEYERIKYSPSVDEVIQYIKFVGNSVDEIGSLIQIELSSLLQESIKKETFNKRLT